MLPIEDDVRKVERMAMSEDLCVWEMLLLVQRVGSWLCAHRALAWLSMDTQHWLWAAQLTRVGEWLSAPVHVMLSCIWSGLPLGCNQITCCWPWLASWLCLLPAVLVTTDTGLGLYSDLALVFWNGTSAAWLFLTPACLLTINLHPAPEGSCAWSVIQLPAKILSKHLHHF